MVEVTGSNPVLPTKKDHLQLVVNSLKTTLETTLGVLILCEFISIYWVFRGFMVARRELYTLSLEPIVFTGDSLCKPNKNLGRNVNNVNSHLYSFKMIQSKNVPSFVPSHK